MRLPDAIFYLTCSFVVSALGLGNGYKSLYGHMNSVLVSQGQAVEKGQVIGTMGNTGYSYGCHLHLQLEYGGSYINPLSVY